MRKAVLRVVANNHKTLKFRIEGYKEAGKRKRLYFPKKRDALLKLDELRDIVAKEGLQAQNLPLEARRDAYDAYNLLQPIGVKLVEAARYYIEANKQRAASKPINEILTEYLAHRERIGLKETSLIDGKYRLGKLAKVFGEKLASDITHSEIENWVHGIEGSPQTKNNYLTISSAFFEWCMVQGYCINNPIKKITKIRVEDAPVEIFKPEELEKILQASTDEMLPIFAIGAFAGLRMSELMKLEWGEIYFDKNLIEVKASKAKTAKRRFVDILPCLSAWLKKFRGKTGPIWPYTRFNFSQKRDILAKKLNIKWPNNGLRHSFATYHCAAFENQDKTASQLGHPNTDMLYSKYRELVTREEALKYWAVFPTTNK